MAAYGGERNDDYLGGVGSKIQAESGLEPCMGGCACESASSLCAWGSGSESGLEASDGEAACWGSAVCTRKSADSAWDSLGGLEAN